MIIGLIFQFCGSIFLVWTAVSKTNREIDDEFKTILKPYETPINIIRKRLFDQYLTVTGFGLFVVGFLPMMIVIKWSYFVSVENIINANFINKGITITVLLGLCVSHALIRSLVLSKRRHKFVNSKQPVPGQLWTSDVSNETSVT